MLARCSQKPFLPGKHYSLLLFQVLLWVASRPPLSWAQAAVHSALVSHLGFEVHWVEAGSSTCLCFRSVPAMWAYHPCEPNYEPCSRYAVSSVLYGLTVFWATIVLKAAFLLS